jgi:hypothetical protein
LLVVLIVGALIGISAVLWWHFRERRVRAA